MFKNLKVLDTVQDRQLTYNSVIDFSFAKEEAVCPIMLSEFIKAARSFPVVFPTSGNIIPQAVLSVQQGGNAYVSESGKWQGAYLPLHLRRYPFVLGQDGEEGSLLIMYDADAPQFKGEKGEALFITKDDKTTASKLLEGVQEYLGGLNIEYQKTKAMFNELQLQNVLIPSQIKVTNAEGKVNAVKGFSIVDWEKVKQLDDTILANWARIGLIQFIHIHLLSLEGIRNSK